MSSSESSFTSDTDSSMGSSHSVYHGSKQKFPCRRCGRYIKGPKYNWYKHIITQHGMDEREQNKDTFYSCSVCQKTFQHKRSCDAHKKVHGFQTQVLVLPKLKPVNLLTPRKKIKSNGDGRDSSSSSPAISTGG